MSIDDALRRLGADTAEALAGVLAQWTGNPATPATAQVLAPDEEPTAGMAGPLVAIAVSFTEAVTGGNVLLLSEGTARALAAAMMGMPPEGQGELSEIELSALAEIGNQAMAAAAASTAQALGALVEVGLPEVLRFADPAEAMPPRDGTTHAIATPIDVNGDGCLLVQLVPTALVVRMADAMTQEALALEDTGTDTANQDEVAAGLREVRVRVWAELGRADLALGDAARLSPGAIIGLDEDVDDPIVLYAGGAAFALGRLLRAPDGAWSVRIEELLGDREGDGELVA